MGELSEALKLAIVIWPMNYWRNATVRNLSTSAVLYSKQEMSGRFFDQPQNKSNSFLSCFKAPSH